MKLFSSLAHYQFRCDNDDLANICAPLEDHYGCRKTLAVTIIGLPRDRLRNLFGTSSRADWWNVAWQMTFFCRTAYFSSLAIHSELMKRQEVQWVFGKPLVKSYLRILIANGSSRRVWLKSTPLVHHIFVGAGTKKWSTFTVTFPSKQVGLFLALSLRWRVVIRHTNFREAEGLRAMAAIYFKYILTAES